MAMPHRVYVQRRMSVETELVGIGTFGPDGTRDILGWIRGMSVQDTPGGGVSIYARKSGVPTCIFRTARAGRTDDDLRVIAGIRHLGRSGYLVHVEDAPPTMPVTKTKKNKTKVEE